MSRNVWIAILVVAGVAGAIVIGIWATSGGGESQADAQQAFCSSLSTLESSVEALTSLDPTSASKSDYQSAVSTIESDWDQVKSDASNLASIDMSTLDSAWDSFKSAVDDVPDDASVSDALSDVKSSADSLVSTVKSTLTGPDCSSS
jgi:hypothetical protein